MLNVLFMIYTVIIGVVGIYVFIRLVNFKSNREYSERKYDFVIIIMGILFLIGVSIKNYNSIVFLTVIFIFICRDMCLHNDESHSKIKALQQELKESQEQIRVLKEKEEAKK